MRLLIAAALLVVCQARPGLILTQPLVPLGIQYANTAPVVHPHPSVELNAASEALLPSDEAVEDGARLPRTWLYRLKGKAIFWAPRELLKSRDFYDNSAIADGLARESWFTNKEMQVVEREAEKIPRESIYRIVKNAGFLDRH